MLRLRTQVTVVADEPPAQVVGDLGHGADLAAPGARTGRRARPRRAPGRRRRRRGPRARGPGRRRLRVGEQRRRARPTPRSTTRCCAGRSARPRRRVPASMASSMRSGNTAPGSSRPRPSASVRSSTAKRTAGSSQRSGSSGELGVDREPGRQLEAGGLGGGAQHVEGGPRALGVDVVGGDRRDAAPVVDAGVEQVGRAASARTGWAAPAGGRRRAGSRGPGRWRRAKSSCGHGGAACIAVPGFGRKFWTITSCTWPWRRWLAAMASRASTRSARSSPMPTRMPVVNGMASSPAASRVARRRVGRLVGRAAVGGEVGAERLDHHPLARGDGPQGGEVGGVEGAGVGVGEQAGLVERRAGAMATR